ncbi:NAD-binding protein [Haloarcula pellucida]|nr:NAD-binding protein [Halomicroarcula pellucida]MDS0277500.1 NAD-binding protein [Halomicroarcula sp. S1AR25-4]
MSRQTLRDTLARERGPPSVLVVTDRFVGAEIASELTAIATVGVVTDAESVANRADGATPTIGDVTAVETLAAADATDADGAVVALTCDRRTMLVAQLLRARFGVRQVTVLVDDPDLCATFDGIATATVSEAPVLAAETRRQFEPTLDLTVRD